MQLLLLADADDASCSDRCDADGLTPLDLAVDARNTAAVALLIASGCKSETGDWKGQRALHRSCRNNDIDCTRLLLSASARPDVVDVEGRSPIHEAALSGSSALLTLLLQTLDKLPPLKNPRRSHHRKSNGNGAPLSVLNLPESIAHDSSSDAEESDDRCTDCRLLRISHCSMAHKVSCSLRRPINTRDVEGQTALHLAAQAGLADSVKALAEWGACLQVRDGRQWLARDWAVFHGHLRLLEWLVPPLGVSGLQQYPLAPTVADSLRELCIVEFRIRAQVQLGEKLCIVGESQELGSGNPAAAIRMEPVASVNQGLALELMTDANQGLALELWIARVALPPRSRQLYRYVVCEDTEEGCKPIAIEDFTAPRLLCTDEQHSFVDDGFFGNRGSVGSTEQDHYRLSITLSSSSVTLYDEGICESVRRIKIVSAGASEAQTVHLPIGTMQGIDVESPTAVYFSSKTLDDLLRLELQIYPSVGACLGCAVRLLRRMLRSACTAAWPLHQIFMPRICSARSHRF